jgi:alanine-synthesizing transaminase
MANDFFRISQLPPYQLGDVAAAVRDARASGKDVIDFSQVNPATQPPSIAVDRLVQTSLQLHNHRYSASHGIARLRTAFSSWYQRRFSVSLDPNREVVVSLGTKEGLAHLLLAVLSPGSTVLVPTPAYPVHTAAVFLAGASFVGCPLFANYEAATEEGYRLTEKSDEFFGRLEECYRNTWPRPRMMILSFPHNPTATTVTLGFWERMVNFAKVREIYLIHDFAYADLRFEATAAPSILSIPEAREIAVETYSLSKGFGLGGWRIGFVAGCPDLVEALRRIKGYLDFGAFQPLQLGVATLLEQETSALEELLSETNDEYRARRDLLVQGLRRLDWEVHSPEASIFLWAKLPPRLRALGSIDAAKVLLEQASVGVCPGEGFTADASEYMRFALVEPERRIHTALQNLIALEASGNGYAALQ